MFLLQDTLVIIRAIWLSTRLPNSSVFIFLLPLRNYEEDVNRFPLVLVLGSWVLKEHLILVLFSFHALHFFFKKYVIHTTTPTHFCLCVFPKTYFYPTPTTISLFHKPFRSQISCKYSNLLTLAYSVAGLVSPEELETTLWTVVIIIVGYNNKKYYIDIIESKPSNPITIIETDCEVDFAPPLDYNEPERPHPYHPCHLTKRNQNSTTSASNGKQLAVPGGGVPLPPPTGSSSHQTQGKLVFSSNAASQKQKAPII
ncbi:unnamed protein product [Lactuca virosa]|uniref:Ubiquitin fusion degradation protein UFD1 N-terminal subdomain 2 domain-containing protein n=1 Tax=Lactuca virosa TaxID=75947 RepID=A0AAU9PLG4_9ASTR|nr:unnamed protein product [Lactuca virosa]